MITRVLRNFEVFSGPASIASLLAVIYDLGEVALWRGLAYELEV